MENTISHSEQGKKNRAAGKRFEEKVRKDLEKQGWTVTKWMNNFDLASGKIVPAKRKWNPFKKMLMMVSGGFPDLLALKFNGVTSNDDGIDSMDFTVIAVESKSDSFLKKERIEQCRKYIELKIFEKILVARKGPKRGEIIYLDFAKEERWQKNS